MKLKVNIITILLDASVVPSSQMVAKIIFAEVERLKISLTPQS
jgi:hypothetical protein